MSIVSNAQHWQVVGINLDDHYRELFLNSAQDAHKGHRYFDYYNLFQENKFMDGLSPKHDKFFGPKICAIVLIGKPYGEVGEPGHQTIVWPPPGFADSKQKIKDCYDQWAKYELHFYGDADIIQKFKEVETDVPTQNKFEELMNSTFSHLEQECTEMADYGWKWEGRLETTEPASYFYPVFDKFYGLSE